MAAATELRQGIYEITTKYCGSPVGVQLVRSDLQTDI